MNNNKFEIVADQLEDRLGDDPLADHAREVAGSIVAGLVGGGEPQQHWWSKRKADGSWQVAAQVGTRWLLLGCDIDEVSGFIFLNYLKWDRLREVRDWFAGTLMNDPKVKS